MKVFRWILVLPAALVGWLAATLVAGMVIAIFIQPPADQSPFDLTSPLLWVVVARDAISGFLFVYLGARTAPKRQFVVALILALLAFILLTRTVVSFGRPLATIPNAVFIATAIGLVYRREKHCLQESPNSTGTSFAVGTFIGCLAKIIFFGVGLVQVAAFMCGLIDWWKIPWWIAIFIAAPLSYVPVLGTILGVMGAIKAWHWTAPVAIVLFCWPYVFYFAAIAVGGTAVLFDRIRGR